MKKSIKQQVIEESIQRATDRLKEIMFIINARPLTDIIELRKHFASRLPYFKANAGSQEALREIKELNQKGKDLFALADKQSNSTELIQERIKLESELTDLNNELYQLERAGKLVS